jgi:hypothetical protein
MEVAFSEFKMFSFMSKSKHITLGKHKHNPYNAYDDTKISYHMKLSNLIPLLQ